MRDPKDIIINGKQLSEILESHKKWLFDDGGECANLRSANLSYADLRSADLRSADLRSADLRSADLSYADLSYANLRSANLSYANLRSANLSYADLRSADLRSANLSYADLRYANLSYAKNLDMVNAITSILPDGDIIGWKKCKEGIVMLLIPSKAKRSNSTGRKCRAEYAVDKAHFTFEGKKTKEKFTSTYDGDFVYEVGKTIKPSTDFDENRWEECSTGVHFFITRWEAENY